MWPSRNPYLLVVPALAAILLLFFGGFILGVMESMGFASLGGRSLGPLEAYSQLVNQEDFWRSFFYTLRISLLSTLFSAGFGLILGLFLERAGGFWQRLGQLPLLIPHLAAAYLMVLLFMQSGWLSRFAYAFGMTERLEQFPVLIHEPFGWGIIFTYIWKESPFIAFMVYPALKGIRGQWHEPAKMLGAGRWSYFREIVFPLLLPSWLSASFIVFAFTFSAFEVPLLLGVTYPEMLSVYAYRLFSGGILEDRPLALAASILMACMTAFLGWLAYRLSKGWLGSGRRGWS